MKKEQKEESSKDIKFKETPDSTPGEPNVASVKYNGSGDTAIKEFSRGSLYNETNQQGTGGKVFQQEPRRKAISSDFLYPEKLRTTKHKVPNFWVYDGAHNTIGRMGHAPTSRNQILPNKRISEQDAIEYQRLGSKKGWMFNGNKMEKYGFEGETKPTHTSDGFPKRIKETKWFPTQVSEEKQGVAKHELPEIDIENNARGIGVTGPGSGQGGMAGGYQNINPSRLKQLPVPHAKYNWTGSRPHGTARDSGKGGFRAGYKSQYPERPYFMPKRSQGIRRIRQKAAVGL